MLCPKCDSNTKVLDTRFDVDCVTRKRCCLSCGHKFVTVEVDADWLERIKKTNDRLQRKV